MGATEGGRLGDSSLTRVLHPTELRGRHVVLTPLEVGDADALLAAATVDRTTYGFTPVPGSADEVDEQVRWLLDERSHGACLPFVLRAASDGTVLGQTRLSSMRTFPGFADPAIVEIGGTWLTPSAQRTAVNTEAKRLLLAHAFDDLGVERVELRTDVRNAVSRAAIARIGATFEGVLRSWQPSFAPGEAEVLRDTAMFSILRREWPAVRDGLDARLHASALR